MNKAIPSRQYTFLFRTEKIQVFLPQPEDVLNCLQWEVNIGILLDTYKAIPGWPDLDCMGTENDQNGLLNDKEKVGYIKKGIDQRKHMN